jgi:hypothetical protein
MANNICQYCNKNPAKLLEPIDYGPIFGLELEIGSDRYCSHECWELEMVYSPERTQTKTTG